VKFAEGEAGGQELADADDEQSRDGDDESLIMKQKETPRAPPGMPHPELWRPAEAFTLHANIANLAFSI
jgi:hypothetical protein